MYSFDALLLEPQEPINQEALVDNWCEIIEDDVLDKCECVRSFSGAILKFEVRSCLSIAK